MVDNISKEKRTYVRGNISFKVKFKIISSDEYQDLKGSNKEIISHAKIEKGIDLTDIDNRNADITSNPYIIDFLLCLDEKLDRILAILSKDTADNEGLNQGMGSNISGSGMNIITDKSIEPGNIIHTTFVLSRFPLVFIDVFGEVARITPVDEGGKTYYHLGVKFLDLDLNDRERIISRVFQSQREDIRRTKDENLTAS